MKQTAPKATARSGRDQPSAVVYAATTATEPSPANDVRVRAYEIFLNRVHTGTPGDDISDWLQAEHEATLLRSRGSNPAPDRGELDVVVRSQPLRHPASLPREL